MIEQLIERFGGKGGGRGAMAQGGGLTGAITDVANAARDIVARLQQ